MELGPNKWCKIRLTLLSALIESGIYSGESISEIQEELLLRKYKGREY